MDSNDCKNIFQTQFKVLELYSGIGGMHLALKNLPLDSYQLMAIEINSSANLVYNQNHLNCKLFERNILSINENDFNEWSIDLLLMSPPCQPFTRLGLKRDLKDFRSDSFVHLMQTFPKIKNLPKYILIENVKGFESSDTRALLIQTLTSCGYSYQEFLLSPNQFSIPNSRLRYYLIAKLKTRLDFDCNTIVTEVPELDSNNLCAFCSHVLFHSKETDFKPLKHYLEDLDENQIQTYLLSDNVLKKYFMILDVVRTDSLNTNCFTKGYSHHIEGAGSVLQTNEDQDIQQICSQLNECQTDGQKLSVLRRLGLRYFTPKEISNFMCFPKDFREF